MLSSRWMILQKMDSMDITGASLSYNVVSGFIIIIIIIFFIFNILYIRPLHLPGSLGIYYGFQLNLFVGCLSE